MERQAKRTQINRKRWLIFLLVIAILACGIIALLPFRQTIWNHIYHFLGLTDYTSVADDYPLSVHYLDVGKADSILIEQEGHWILIDGGDKEERNRVLEYLRRRQVTSLDMVVVTHPDRDHIGAMEDIVREYSIEQFLMPKIQENLIVDSTRYQKMMEEIEKKNMPITYPKSGDTFEIGGMILEVLGPISSYEDVNNSSLVLRLRFGERVFLFMGDAENKAEDDLLANNISLKCDVLKVGHHGSKTSTSAKFLKEVQPQIAVVSTGEDRNDLPKGEVVERIEQVGADLHRTDLEGTIIVSTDGQKLTVTTEKSPGLFGPAL